MVSTQGPHDPITYEESRDQARTERPSDRWHTRFGIEVLDRLPRCIEPRCGKLARNTYGTHCEDHEGLVY